MDGQISKRQLGVLDFIIKEHVKTAKPVGSALIAKKAGFKLSPATLRNEMGELEKAGYLAQLHTSGGRVPTDKAYRYYVNSLLETKKSLNLETGYKKKIKDALSETPPDPREINKVVARVLSNLSGSLVITGISTEFLRGLKHREETTPSQDQDFFKKGLI